MLNITEILVGSGSKICGTSMGLVNLGAGIIISSSTALSTSIATLITNEYLSKLKIRYTKLRDWIKVITLPYKKTLKTSMVDEKIDEKEAQELKKIYNHEPRKDKRYYEKYTIQSRRCFWACYK